MKIILFGYKGQVGKEVVELLLQKGDEFIGFDVDNLDIADRQAVFSAITKNSDADIVINAAAYTAVDKAEDEEDLAYAVNSNGVENLALACKQHNIPLIHISTDYVFSGDKKGPYSEDDLVDPLGVYGKSKLAGEEALRRIWEKHIILRISWVFGKYGNNFVKTIFRLAKERENLRVVGDQYGCPTPAADVARVLLELSDEINRGQTKWGTYHYCGETVTSWYEFAQKIVDLAKEKYNLKLNKLDEITTQDYPTRAKRPVNSELKVAKITKNYGIERHAWLNYLQDVITKI